MKMLNILRISMAAKKLGGEMQIFGESLKVGNIEFIFIKLKDDLIEIDVDVDGTMHSEFNREKGLGINELRQALHIWNTLVALNAFEGLRVKGCPSDSDGLGAKRQRLFERLGFVNYYRQF